MRNSIKATLLSGLVFPGAGQIALGYYARGFFLVLGALAGLAILLVEAAQKAFDILDKIVMQGAPININTLLKASIQASTSVNDRVFTLVLSFLVLLWALGTVDAYRIGNKKDKDQSTPSRL
jgi:hypothetical protein